MNTHYISKAGLYLLSAMVLAVVTCMPFALSISSLSNAGGASRVVSTSFAYAADEMPRPGTGDTSGEIPRPGKGSDTPGAPTKVEFVNPLKFDSVELLLTGLVSLAVRLGTLVAIFFFIYAGFRYVTAMGDQTKITDARKTLTNAAIGTAILVGASVIVTLVQNTLTSIQK